MRILTPSERPRTTGVLRPWTSDIARGAGVARHHRSTHCRHSCKPACDELHAHMPRLQAGVTRIKASTGPRAVSTTGSMVGMSNVPSGPDTAAEHLPPRIGSGAGSSRTNRCPWRCSDDKDESQSLRPARVHNSGERLCTPTVDNRVHIAGPSARIAGLTSFPKVCPIRQHSRDAFGRRRYPSHDLLWRAIESRGPSRPCRSVLSAASSPARAGAGSVRRDGRRFR